MSRIAYLNGVYRLQRDACVNIEDRGYQFGDGVYEVLHLHRGRFIDVDLHLGRLERSLSEIQMTMPVSRLALVRILGEVARRNRLLEGLLYMQVTRGVARRDHFFPPAGTPPALVVTVRRIPPYPTSPDHWAGNAVTAPDLRWARCDIKSVNLLPNVLARQFAREQGAIETILVRDGMVTEGAATSFWIVTSDGVLVTRPLDRAILPGCTRAALITELSNSGIHFQERSYSEAEMRIAKEAFITSATSFVKPIIKIDGRPVGDGAVGPVTRRLFDLFARHVQGGVPCAA